MKRSFWRTIRGKLVSRTMLVVLIPLLILGGAAVAAMTSITRSADESVAGTRAQLGEDVVGQGAAHNATMVAADLAVFLDERLRDVLAWSDAATIRGAARDGHDEARSLGLLRMSTEEVDDLYSDGREIGTLATVGELATNLRNSPSFTQLNITDRNGFNVATANGLFAVPTGVEDMVQSDETWWQEAWERGIFIADPVYSEFSRSSSLTIAVRLNDLATPVGVLRATLDISVVQELAGHSMSGMSGMADGESMPDGDAMSGMADGESMSDGDAMPEMAGGDPNSHQMTGFAGFDVTIVAASGMLLAETSSGNSSDRIMNPDINIGADANPRLAILAAPEETRRADHPNMYSLTDDWVAGYAHVLDSFNDINQSDRVTLDDVGSLDWIVIAQQPADVGFATLGPLEDLNSDLKSTSSALTLLLIIVVVIGLIGALVSSWLFARRITDPIQTLRNAAVIAANETLPNIVAKIDELGPDEEIPTLSRCVSPPVTRWRILLTRSTLCSKRQPTLLPSRRDSVARTWRARSSAWVVATRTCWPARSSTSTPWSRRKPAPTPFSGCSSSTIWPLACVETLNRCSFSRVRKRRDASSNRCRCAASSRRPVVRSRSSTASTSP